MDQSIQPSEPSSNKGGDPHDIFADLKQIARDVREHASEMFGDLDQLFFDARDSISQTSREVFDELKALSKSAKYAIPTKEVERALLASVKVGEMLKSGHELLCTDGMPLKGNFDSFEEREIEIYAALNQIVIGVKDSKKFLLYLENPTDPESRVAVGVQGFDEIKSYGWVLVGTNEKGHHIINPATGAQAVPGSLWDRGQSSS